MCDDRDELLAASQALPSRDIVIVNNALNTELVIQYFFQWWKSCGGSHNYHRSNSQFSESGVLIITLVVGIKTYYHCQCNGKSGVIVKHNTCNPSSPFVGYKVATLWRVVTIQLEKIGQSGREGNGQNKKVMVFSPCELDGWMERGDG